MVKPKFYKYGAILLLGVIITFGYTTRVVLKEHIEWDDRLLEWPDFMDTFNVEGNFHASVSSGFKFPEKIVEGDSRIVAVMDPNLSRKLRGIKLTDQLLIHEQYHFNISEYCTRLLRKEISELGVTNITTHQLETLYSKFKRKRDSLQYIYDNESEHNLDQEKQHFWEFKIDDLLRRTAYYTDPNMFSYNKPKENETEFFRKIYPTVDHTILKSYPIDSIEAKLGEVYQIVSKDNISTIKYYKNGQLLTGGYYETAITNIIHNEDNIEIQYRNADSTHNSDLPFTSLQSALKSNGDFVTHYFNEKGERVKNGRIYERLMSKVTDSSFVSTYYNENKRLVKNKSDIYHEKRTLDSNKRTIKVESFDKDKRRMLNDDFISIYKMQYDYNNNISKYSLFNEREKFAKHINSFNRSYTYDERGNIQQRINLDVDGKKADDTNGVCTYKNTYDKFDNNTSVRKYNHLDLPVLGLDGYFQEVTDYDGQNRLKFVAQFFPGYVLYFDENKWGGTKYKYPHESIVERHNVDSYKNPFNSDTGVGVSKSVLNTSGLAESLTYLDFGGGAAKTEDGIVEFVYKYDERGNQIEETTKDSLGCIKPFELDVANVKWKYDDRYNKIQTTYYNTAGDLAKGAQNVTFNYYDYNEQNLLVERRNYDINMKPKEFDGAFKIRVWTNRFKKDSIDKYYDSNNNLIKGVSIIKYAYNKYGTLTKETYFDRYGNRVKDDYGVSSIRFLLDQKQQSIGYEYFDENEKPVNDVNGIFKEKRWLTDAGFIKTIEYFDKNGQPVLGVDGYYKAAYEWHKTGEISSYSTFGVDRKYKENSEGIAQVVYIRYPSLLIKEIRNYDKNLHLTENKEGVAVYLYREDLNGLYYIDEKLNADEEVIEDTESGKD